MSTSNFLLVGTPLARDSEVYIDQLECSPVLGGYAVVFSDGRGGFLSSQTPESKPSVSFNFCLIAFRSVLFKVVIIMDGDHKQQYICCT